MISIYWDNSYNYLSLAVCLLVNCQHFQNVYLEYLVIEEDFQLFDCYCLGPSTSLTVYFFAFGYLIIHLFLSMSFAYYLYFSQRNQSNIYFTQTNKISNFISMLFNLILFYFYCGFPDTYFQLSYFHWYPPKDGKSSGVTPVFKGWPSKLYAYLCTFCNS